MESSNVMAMKCGLIVWLFLSSLSIADSFIDEPTPLGNCFKSCLAECVVNKRTARLLCPFKCTKICVADPSTTHFKFVKVDNYSSCELQCAASMCGEFSTKENPGPEKSTLLLLFPFFVRFHLLINLEFLKSYLKYRLY